MPSLNPFFILICMSLSMSLCGSDSESNKRPGEFISGPALKKPRHENNRSDSGTDEDIETWSDREFIEEGERSNSEEEDYVQIGISNVSPKVYKAASFIKEVMEESFLICQPADKNAASSSLIRDVPGKFVGNAHIAARNVLQIRGDNKKLGDAFARLARVEIQNLGREESPYLKQRAQALLMPFATPEGNDLETLKSAFNTVTPTHNHQQNLGSIEVGELTDEEKESFARTELGTERDITGGVTKITALKEKIRTLYLKSGHYYFKARDFTNALNSFNQADRYLPNTYGKSIN